MESTPYLFVYGTLMHGFENKYARYLHRHSTYIGRGWMPGRLFDLGSYPGAVFDASTERKVQGDVFLLRDLAAVLRELDEYEGVGEAFPVPREYRRTVVPVVVGEVSYPCWVYLYNLNGEPGQLIDQGEYGE